MKKFKEIIKTREEFRSIMKEPSELVTRKTLSYLDKHCGALEIGSVAKSRWLTQSC